MSVGQFAIKTKNASLRILPKQAFQVCRCASPMNFPSFSNCPFRPNTCVVLLNRFRIIFRFRGRAFPRHWALMLRVFVVSELVPFLAQCSLHVWLAPVGVRDRVRQHAEQCAWILILLTMMLNWLHCSRLLWDELNIAEMRNSRQVSVSVETTRCCVASQSVQPSYTHRPDQGLWQSY